MARVIEFHIPQNYRSLGHWVPPRLRGRIIEFEDKMRDRMFLKRVQIVSTLSQVVSR